MFYITIQMREKYLLRFKNFQFLSREFTAHWPPSFGVNTGSLLQVLSATSDIQSGRQKTITIEKVFCSLQLMVVSWLGFIVISRRIHFYVNNQFYFNQFSLAWVHSLIVQNISILNYSIYSNSSNSAYSA